MLSALVLLPLCSLKSLASLAPFSLLGLGGTLYTAIFMIIRFLDKSYATGGRFFSQIALQPTFNVRGGYALNHLTFVLLSMLSTSYIAHYNAPKFYAELRNPSMARFNRVISGAFGASILFFVLIMCVGFLTFGGATQGFILNNYASGDLLATLARFAIGVALVTGYPFTFSALREGLLDMGGVKGEARGRAFQAVTIGLLSLVTALALVLRDVGFVVSISGALFGCALMFVVPAIMTIKNLGRLVAAGQGSKNSGLERAFNYGLILTGSIMGALGVFVSTMRQLGKM
jgi:amino acid permease